MTMTFKAGEQSPDEVASDAVSAMRGLHGMESSCAPEFAPGKTWIYMSFAGDRPFDAERLDTDALSEVLREWISDAFGESDGNAQIRIEDGGIYESLTLTLFGCRDGAATKMSIIEVE